LNGLTLRKAFRLKFGVTKTAASETARVGGDFQRRQEIFLLLFYHMPVQVYVDMPLCCKMQPHVSIRPAQSDFEMVFENVIK